MTPPPFQLSIKCTFPNSRNISLECKTLLRSIPGRRDVYEALWEGNPIIIKVFSHRFSAKRHLRREWRGITKLSKLHLSSPKPLFYGMTGDGRWTVAEEKITDSTTALEAFERAQGDKDKFWILNLVCKEIAKQHDNGVTQRDLHLENYLISREKVYAIDPGQMSFRPEPLSKKVGLSRLAMFAGYFHDDDIQAISKLCKSYLEARGMPVEKSDERFFIKERSVHRKRAIRRGLKKTLRTSKRYRQIKSDTFNAVFEKRFLLKAEPFDILTQIDSFMDAGSILKDGNTCFVSRIKWNDQSFVVKRYNHKGLIHSLRYTMKKSRAHRGWLYGHRLGMLSIGTPKPLAYIEKYRGPIIWQSYLLTEYIHGETIHKIMNNSQFTEQERSNKISQVDALLQTLRKYKIIHGDLKPSNIIITDDGPVVTDLDGMKIYRLNRLYEKRRIKDVARFYRAVGVDHSNLL